MIIDIYIYIYHNAFAYILNYNVLFFNFYFLKLDIYINKLDLILS